MDFSNSSGNSFGMLPYSGVTPFSLGQLHNYPTQNNNGDNLISRYLLSNPEINFGTEETPKYEGIEEGLDSIENILPDKSKSLKSLVDIISSEVEKRKILNENHLERVDEEIIKFDNYILELDSIEPQKFRPERTRTHFQQSIMRLESEKRAEEVGCFRDLIFIQKDLLAALKDYWTAKNREEMLSGIEIGEGDYIGS